MSGDEFLVDDFLGHVQGGPLHGVKPLRNLAVARKPCRSEHVILVILKGFHERQGPLRSKQGLKARRDEPADDDVFLEAAQPVTVAGYRCHGQNLGGFLEGRLGQEAVGGEGRLGYAKQQSLGGGWFPTLGQHAVVLVLEPELVHHVAGDELGVAGGFHLNPAEHLAQDHFDVLVVNADALRPVNFLDLVHQVVLQALQSADVQQFPEIQGTVNQGVAGPDLLTVAHLEIHLRADVVRPGFFLAPDDRYAVGRHFHLALVVRANLLHDAGAGQRG